MERPIFIFAAGWRTGSTLLQRLINSHPDILVWGENHAFLDGILRARESILKIQHYSQRHAANFRKQGSMGWIAAMNPPAERFDDGVRKLLDAYFRDPARDLGKCRWGFKEVRHCGDAARFLFELYPSARFLLLLRHPEDCLASARALSTPPMKGILAEIGGPHPFLEHWANVAASFLCDRDVIPNLMLYYEKMVAEPEGTIEAIAQFIGIKSEGLNRHVFEVRRRGGLGLPPRLTRDDRKCLASPQLWSVAERHGYEPRTS